MERVERIGGLVAAIAHDLNNVLLVIGGHCDLLLSQVPEHSPVRASLLEIRDAYARAALLTRRLGSAIPPAPGPAEPGGPVTRSAPARPQRTRLLPPNPPRASQS